ncbi:hypothetical protein AB0M28_08645 [Streptomyces sp. NPDC051940]|uniref:hypothetical protein n=1 Tax=Streptomyces sp. NPDC051940 TaxID=3155675 RepID=UPI0034299099
MNAALTQSARSLIASALLLGAIAAGSAYTVGAIADDGHHPVVTADGEDTGTTPDPTDDDGFGWG